CNPWACLLKVVAALLALHPGMLRGSTSWNEKRRRTLWWFALTLALSQGRGNGGSLRSRWIAATFSHVAPPLTRCPTAAVAFRRRLPCLRRARRFRSTVRRLGLPPRACPRCGGLRVLR